MRGSGERRRHRHDERVLSAGYSLMEVLVVLFIFSILIAIAVPSLLTVTKNGDNQQAQSELETALTAADAYFSQYGQSFAGLETSSTTYSDIQQIDTGLSYQSHSVASNTPRAISALVTGSPSGSVLIIVSKASTGDCWGILDIKSLQTTAVLSQTKAGTYFFVDRKNSLGTCTATNASSSATVTTSNYGESANGFSAVAG